MADPVIAILFDFDGTLAGDSITSMLKKSNIDADEFWERITKMVERGWDPPIASMTRILELVGDGSLDLTTNRMRELGGELKPFSGLPEMFDQLQQMVKDKREFSDAGIKLEFYIISGGLEEIIRGSPTAKHMTGIFGCTFEHDDKTNQPVAIKSAISFTEKTRFLFGIHNEFWSSIGEIQFIQKKAGSLLTLIVLKDENRKKRIEGFLKNRFSIVDLKINYVHKIRKTSRGKHRYFVSEIGYQRKAGQPVNSIS